MVVVRYGENPLGTIKNVKEKIMEISPGLPKKTLTDGRASQVTIIHFYDRTGLIYETLGTLNDALRNEILITVIVILLMGHAPEDLVPHIEPSSDDNPDGLCRNEIPGS